MEDVLLVHHLALHLAFQLLPFFCPFLPVPLQVNLDSVKIEQLEFHCLAVTPASRTKLGLLTYLSVTCMRIKYTGEKGCEGDC